MYYRLPLSGGRICATKYATIERMEDGRNVQSPLVSNDPFYLKYFSSIFEEF
jgi:hypothetical protein